MYFMAAIKNVARPLQCICVQIMFEQVLVRNLIFNLSNLTGNFSHTFHKKKQTKLTWMSYSINERNVQTETVIKIGKTTLTTKTSPWTGMKYWGIDNLFIYRLYNENDQCPPIHDWGVACDATFLHIYIKQARVYTLSSSNTGAIVYMHVLCPIPNAVMIAVQLSFSVLKFHKYMHVYILLMQ